MEDLNQVREPRQEQIAQAEKLAAIGHLAPGLAHELNTPLGVIISNLSVLRQYGDSLANFAGVALQALDALEPPVMGQLGEMTQVFVHLLLNAAQALEGLQETITLETRQELDQVVMRVTDTGCGMTAEQLARMFNPFFTTRPTGHRTGMGLAVCHGITVRHGGTIGVEGTVGLGTTVTLRLPAAATAPAKAA